MIQLRRNPNDRICELGGGGNPVCAPRKMGGRDLNVDVRDMPTVDVVADFEKPLPPEVTPGIWDAVVSVFALEHVSYPKVPQLVGEMFRVCKPGGHVVVVIPNTEAQMKYILSKPEWDGDESCMLFGQQDYQANSHKAAFSPRTVTTLFQKAGFVDILIRPYGVLATDMVIEAVKPVENTPVEQPVSVPIQPEQPVRTMSGDERASLFDRHYFNGGTKVGGYSPFYMDHPINWVIFQNVMAHKPRSVLEVGPGRGYVLKRLEDAGILCCGLDISRHAVMTRVMDHISLWDVCQIPWPITGSVDLFLAIDSLDRIPEPHLHEVIAEARRLCSRGLVALDFNARPSDPDKTRFVFRPPEWWRSILGAGFEVVSTQELSAGQFPPEVLNGDGRIKLNLGCAFTQFHHGWENIDVVDAIGFAQGSGYKFRRHDLRAGIPYSTGVVDLVFLHHALEHFNYREGLSLLRECRRVIRPDGGLRIAVPNVELIMADRHALQGYGEINEEVALAGTDMERFWAMTAVGHQAFYDMGSLCQKLQEAGFTPTVQQFRKSLFPQILRETLEMPYGLTPGSSLFVDAMPTIA